MTFKDLSSGSQTLTVLPCPKEEDFLVCVTGLVAEAKGSWEEERRDRES